MSDDADRAADEEIAFREHNLRRVTKRVAPSIPARKFCEGCGMPIPKARRKAVPGACRCVDCQFELERRVA